MILARIHVIPRVVPGTALADNDVACYGFLAPEYLYAQAFRFRFASVLRTSYTFLVCLDL